jgi:hypothetical protein
VRQVASQHGRGLEVVRQLSAHSCALLHGRVQDRLQHPIGLSLTALTMLARRLVIVLFRLRRDYRNDGSGMSLTRMATLEQVLQQLQDSEINAGVQTFYDTGMRVWIGDEANGIRTETTIDRTASFVAPRKWPEGSLQRAGCTRSRYVCTPIANMPRATRTKQTSLVEKRAERFALALREQLNPGRCNGGRPG